MRNEIKWRRSINGGLRKSYKAKSDKHLGLPLFDFLNSDEL